LIKRYYNPIYSVSPITAAVKTPALFGVQYDQNNENHTACHPVEVDKLITSGSIINVDVYRKLGPFDENLFIDEVDHEYCYRAILKNYAVVQMSNIYMNHSPGYFELHHSLKNLEVTSRRLHSASRMYYMVRKFLYVKEKYGKYLPKSIHSSRKALLVQIKNNLLYNKERLSVLKYIPKGYKHFKRRKWGKL
jgi:rhamnosyltransferase